jgi:hypothetical protein
VTSGISNLSSRRIARAVPLSHSAPYISSIVDTDLTAARSLVVALYLDRPMPRGAVALERRALDEPAGVVGFGPTITALGFRLAAALAGQDHRRAGLLHAAACRAWSVDLHRALDRRPRGRRRRRDPRQLEMLV